MNDILEEYEEKEPGEEPSLGEEHFDDEELVVEDEVATEDEEIAEDEDEREERDGHSDDAIQCYLREIQRTKLLTAEDERELAGKIANGDEAARNRMIESNLRLVVKISKRYMNRGLPFLDLIEEGNIGLIKAVERFKISKECRFSTYATWWIRQSIERALINQSRTIRLPVHVSDDINRLVKVSREISNKRSTEADAAEIADAMGTDVAHVRRLMVLLRKTFSIEHPMGENSDYSLMDTLEDTGTVTPAVQVEDLDTYAHISRHFDSLSQAEQDILILRFGLNDEEPQTLDAIGKQFGVTRERIRQIEVKSLEKLRRMADGTYQEPAAAPAVRRKRP